MGIELALLITGVESIDGMPWSDLQSPFFYMTTTTTENNNKSYTVPAETYH